jgi:hypothetical protein
VHMLEARPSRLGGKADANAGDNDPIVPFGARFFKNARACPRPANPHCQALYKSSTLLPLPLSADLPLCFALSIAKPPTEFARDICGKRLRRTRHPTTVHTSLRFTATTTFSTPVTFLSCAALRVRNTLRVNALIAYLGTQFGLSTSPTPVTKSTPLFSAIRA